MALILQLAISIENAVFEAFSYIFNLLSRLFSQYITQNFIYPTKAKPQIAPSPKEEKYHQEGSVVCSSVRNRCGSKDSLCENKTKKSLKNNKSNVGTNKKHNVVSNKTHRIIFGYTVPVENANKRFNIHDQQYCAGDSGEFLKPVMHYLESRNKSEERIYLSPKLNREIKQNKMLRINTVPKYTVSLMDILDTNTEIILNLVDELNKDTVSNNELHNDLSKGAGSHRNLCEVQNCSEKRKFKHRNCLSQMKTLTVIQEEVENNNVDLCYCSDTHKCLLDVDSEEDTTPEDLYYVDNDPVVEGHFTLKDLAYEADNPQGKGLLIFEDLTYDDEAIKEELLTPEELASVDTGFDDDWLYKATQSVPISISA